MFLLEAAVRGALVPAIVCGSFLAVCRKPWRGEGSPAGEEWSEPFALAAGYLAGHVGVVGMPAFPPLDSREAFAYLALGSALLGSLASAKGLLPSVRLASLLSLAFGIPLLLLRTRIANVWSPGESTLWVTGLGSGALAVIGALRSTSRMAGPAPVLALLVPTVAASGVLLLSGNAALAQLDGALAACLGVTLGFSLLQGRRGLSAGSATFAGAMLYGFAVVRAVFGEVPVTSAVLLCISPIFSCTYATRSRMVAAPTRRKAVLLTLVAGLPAMTAMAIGFLSSQADQGFRY